MLTAAAGDGGAVRWRRIACWTWRGCGRGSCCGGFASSAASACRCPAWSTSASGAALIASRHQSAFDTIVWLTLVPRCCYVLKRELLRIPLFGPLMPLAGMIAVDRSGGAGALRALVRDGERAAREGRQIVIFPEGTRADPGAMLPLQPGVAALAARTHLPVIPVVTNSGRFWGRRAFHKRAGTIQIRVLKPIPPGIGRDQLMQRLEAALRSERCGELCGLSSRPVPVRGRCGRIIR